MLKDCPEWYDETYKWYTRRGSQVLANEQELFVFGGVQKGFGKPTQHLVNQIFLISFHSSFNNILSKSNWRMSIAKLVSSADLKGNFRLNLLT